MYAHFLNSLDARCHAEYEKDEQKRDYTGLSERPEQVCEGNVIDQILRKF